MKTKIEDVLADVNQTAADVECKFNDGVVNGFNKEPISQEHIGFFDAFLLGFDGVVLHQIILVRSEERLAVLYQTARGKPDPWIRERN
jgi:hypothetical protein